MATKKVSHVKIMETKGSKNDFVLIFDQKAIKLVVLGLWEQILFYLG